ncbi:MAG: TIGR02594 family protein [Nitrososphaera sp.]|nr:TIGR02594 family protein [Nitrososphaera sp.]
MADEKWLELARKELGTKEFPGAWNNPKVVSYFTDAVGIKRPDAIPWCAAFVGAMLTRAGKKSSGSLMARSYLKWGKKLTTPIPGAIVVFPRGKPPSGHTAIVERVTGKFVEVIGGNQSDAVTRKRFPIASALGWRWPT